MAKKKTRKNKTATKAGKGKAARKKSAKKSKKESASGAVSPISHIGFRAELLAQYAFTAWGTVTPIPTAQQGAIDLYCTLSEKIGDRLWPKTPFTVQVKSNTGP